MLLLHPLPPVLITIVAIYDSKIWGCLGILKFEGGKEETMKKKEGETHTSQQVKEFSSVG